jgi:hypothetical protein
MVSRSRFAILLTFVGMKPNCMEKFFAAAAIPYFKMASNSLKV